MSMLKKCLVMLMLSDWHFALDLLMKNICVEFFIQTNNLSASDIFDDFFAISTIYDQSYHEFYAFKNFK